MSRSGEGSCEPVGGLDTCPARSSRGTTRPAEIRALLDQRRYGHYSTSGDTGTTRPAERRGATRPAKPRASADRVADQRNSPSADRVADEERGGVSRSGEGLRGVGWGLDTCPARPSRGTTRPAEIRALLDQRNVGAQLDQRNSPSADRVADEERGGVSRSGEGLRGLGRGLDTCPAPSSRGTTRPAGSGSRPGRPRPSRHSLGRRVAH